MRKKILIIDDNKTDLLLAQKVLEKEDNSLETFTAESGEEGVKKASSIDIDLVILDIKMPGIDGFETCKRIKAIKPDIKVLILTGIDEPLNIKLASEVGVDLFTTKNLMEYTLYRSIKKVLELNP
ncbi:MAG: response regulator [Candidatus Omnitrophica bacterium]|nr:response regulator [Candidatus Omnitrophota bacterium]MBU1997455.1 response regulator [Candidatus Omnitrophota bacterium]